MAGSTGFEPATSGLTVQCANQAAPRARIYFSRAWRTSVDHTMAQRARQLPSHILPSHIRRSPTEIGAMLRRLRAHAPRPPSARGLPAPAATIRSEEHTSELQSHSDLVCRLLLEKKKKELHSRSRVKQVQH